MGKRRIYIAVVLGLFSAVLGVLLLNTHSAASVALFLLSLGLLGTQVRHSLSLLKRLRLLLRYPQSPVLVGLFVALCLSVVVTPYLVFSLTSQSFQEESYHRLQHSALQFQAYAKMQMKRYAQVLYGLESFFASSENVEPREWVTYIDRLAVRENYPGLRAFRLIRRVRREEAEDFIRGPLKVEADMAGRPAAIISSGDKPEYYVTTFIEPLPGNEAAVGLDVLDHPSRPQVIHKARDTGHLQEVPLTTLKMDPSGKPYMLMLVPIYKSAELLDTVEERRKAFWGYVDVAVDLEEFYGELLTELGMNDLGFEVFVLPEGKDAAKVRVFATHEVGDLIARKTPVRVLDLVQPFIEQPWLFRFYLPSDGGTAEGQRYLPLAFAGLTFLIHILLLMVLLFFLSSHTRALRLARRLTDHVHRSERTNQQVLDAIKDLIVVRGPLGRIRWANKAYCEYFGVNNTQLRGLAAPPSLKEDQVRALMKDETEIFANGRPISIPEEYLAQPSGRTRCFHVVKGALVSAQGEVEMSISVARDITEHQKAKEDLAALNKQLRQSEQKWRAILANNPGVIYRCRCDENWTVEFVNDEIFALSGYPPQDFIHNLVRTYESIILPEDRAIVRQAVMEGVTGRRPFSVVYRIVRRDGVVRWVHERGEPVWDENQRVLCLDGVVFDISDRKLIEDQLGEANLTLQEKERILRQMLMDLKKVNDELKATQKQLFQSEKMVAIGQLAAGVAHEIKNPLAIISLSADELASLEERASDPSRKMHIAMIQRSAERADKVVNEMLAFSHTSEIKMELLDLNAMVREIIDIIGNKTKTKNIVFDPDLSRDGVRIYGDRILLGQVIFNIFSNAVDAIASKGVITVRTTPASGPGGEVVLEIRDDGCGIPAAIMPRLFDPFVTTKEQGQGSGLGLYVVYAILDRHNAHIQAESEEGKGACFTIRFPAHPDLENRT